MATSRHAWPDSGQATIVIDRAVPPDDLGVAPRTIKLVLWCLRGLGHPGSLLAVLGDEVARRTCLDARSVRRAIAALCEAKILTQVQTPAPGRQALYSMDYTRLADWLDDTDRSQAGLGNAGRTVPRSPDAPSPERRTHRPPSGSTPDSVSGTPDFESRTADAPSGVPVRNAGASCIPAKTCIVVKSDDDDAIDWFTIGRKAGLSDEHARTAAQALAAQGYRDIERARNDLERVADRVKSGLPVRTIPGLLLDLLRRPMEPSAKAVKRAKAAQNAERRFQEFVAWLGSSERPSFPISDAIGRHAFKLAVGTLGEAKAFELMPHGRFLAHLCSESEEVKRFCFAHWDELRKAVEQERRAARKGQEVAA